MRMSYAAGAWLRATRSAADRPYLMYTTVHDDRVRPQHRAWDGTILPIDDPWWDTHYPPNGWNCRCSVITLDPAQAEKYRRRPDTPDISWSRFVNQRTGEVSRVPAGIDPGFGYNVGKSFLQALESKMSVAAYDPAEPRDDQGEWTADPAAVGEILKTKMREAGWELSSEDKSALSKSRYLTFKPSSPDALPALSPRGRAVWLRETKSAAPLTGDIHVRISDHTNSGSDHRTPHMSIFNSAQVSRPVEGVKLWKQLAQYYPTGSAPAAVIPEHLRFK